MVWAPVARMLRVAMLHSPGEMLVTAAGAAGSWGRERVLGVLGMQHPLPAPQIHTLSTPQDPSRGTDHGTGPVSEKKKL